MDTIARHLLARAGDVRPGLVAGSETWSWAQVVEASVDRAAWLGRHRSPGPFHVALLLDNVPEFAFWLGAAALSGAVVVGANPTHRGSDLARDLAHTRCQFLVTDSDHLPLVEGLDLGPALGVVTTANDDRVVVVDRPDQHESFGAGDATGVTGDGVAEDSLGYLIFTSGTSGAPKACRCTQGRLARIGAAVAQIYEITPDDVCYVAMPLFHSNALMAGWSPTLVAGATLALPSTGRFSASGFLPDVRRYGATYFNYVGKPLSYVLATPERPDDADNTLSRVFGNEGAEGDIARFAERFGCRVVDSYGSTEGGAVVQRTPDTPRGALGRAPEDTVVIDPDTGQERALARFDSDGRLLNADQAIGELVAKSGAAGFEGYWDNDDAEKARLRNGWYWTGDLAYRDENGFFYFAGRSDDWLRVDGENFSAAPVARILQRHPDVVLAVAYAVPDPVAGDQVMAALQLRPDASFDPEGFAAFLSSQTDMGIKWTPRFVRVADTLPVTATSKVLVRTLRSDAWHGPDPVWWSPDRPTGASYRLMEPADRRSLDDAVAGRPETAPA
ncbi:MAG: AMP-binding protein [Acidimicrobiales bacterium]